MRVIKIEMPSARAQYNSFKDYVMTMVDNQKEEEEVRSLTTLPWISGYGSAVKALKEALEGSKSPEEQIPVEVLVALLDSMLEEIGCDNILKEIQQYDKFATV